MNQTFCAVLSEQIERSLPRYEDAGCSYDAELVEESRRMIEGGSEAECRAHLQFLLDRHDRMIREGKYAPSEGAVAEDVAHIRTLLSAAESENAP